MCVECGKQCHNSCQKEKVITKYGLPEKKTVLRIEAPQTLQPITVKNTVFVQKNGNDATGLVERFDKPFLTIQAAETAALAAFTSRTQTSRILIKVESGNYTGPITINDFIDYDLGNSVISNSSGSCIKDKTTAYTAVTNGAYSSIIYGNATFVGSASSSGTLGVTSVNSGNLNLLIHCNQIYGTSYEAVLLQTANVVIYANKIYMDKNNTATSQCINLATSSDYVVNPSLEVYNAKIYTNQSGSTNSVIEFSNANPGLNENYSKLMLVNCEVGSWSTTRPAINGDHTGTGFGQLTLKNVIIYTSAGACIGDDSAPSILKVYAYGLYANRNYVFGNISSAFVVGSLSLDEDIIFNQGNTI